jgi:hypothetical protein
MNHFVKTSFRQSMAIEKYLFVGISKKSLLLALEGVGDGLSGIADCLLCGRKSALALVRCIIAAKASCITELLCGRLVTL